jgi:hypothetical protein
MSQTEFNDAAKIRVANYEIRIKQTLLDSFHDGTHTGYLRGLNGVVAGIRTWVLAETGALPEIADRHNLGILSIMLAESVMKKLEARFADQIEKVERISPIIELPRNEPPPAPAP